MDLAYPLAFTKDGNIQTQEDDSDGSISDKQVRSHVLHVLDTITGERLLYPDLGIDIGLLFHAVVPELACEKFRITLSQMAGIYSRVSIKNTSDNRISLEVQISTQVVTASYG